MKTKLFLIIIILITSVAFASNINRHELTPPPIGPLNDVVVKNVFFESDICYFEYGVPVPSRIVTIYVDGELYSQGLSVGPTRNGVPFVVRCN